MRKRDRQLNERNNKQCEQTTQTTMKSLYSSPESENMNILLQQSSSDCLCRSIKRRDKADDE